MNSHHRWLLEQLPQWERDGLLTADAFVLDGSAVLTDLSLDGRPFREILKDRGEVTFHFPPQRLTED